MLYTLRQTRYSYLVHIRLVSKRIYCISSFKKYKATKVWVSIWLTITDGVSRHQRLGGHQRQNKEEMKNGASEY